MNHFQVSRRAFLVGGTVAVAAAATAAGTTAVAQSFGSSGIPVNTGNRSVFRETGGSLLDKPTYRFAAVQAEPMWFDLAGTVDKTIELADEAKRNGADLVAFAETWLPGYPAFMWVGDEAYKEPLRERYLENSVVVGGPEHLRLEEASRSLDITIVTGLSERVGDEMYMGTWIIDRGTTVHTQRKLKPSGQEWNIFRSGTSETYAVVESSVGNLGALSCNENRRPLLRDLYYTSREQVHVAAWPAFAFNLGIWGMSAQCSMESSAQYAGEGGVTVIAPTQLLTARYFEQFPLPGGAEGKITVGGGSAAVFGTGGELLTTYLDPTIEGIVYADIARQTVVNAPSGYDADPLTVPANGYRS